MESAGFRHRRSPSSDRFLGMFSVSPPSSSAGAGAGGELIEADVFWTADFTEPTQRNQLSHDRGDRTAFAQRSGILAVLPDYCDRASQVLCRKASISPSPSSRAIPAIPRPPSASQDRDLPAAANPGRQSAPVNVPALEKAMASRRRSLEALEAFGSEEDDDEEDEKVLPPHEMAARGSGVSPRTTFSVLEGVGRTLKGRDLRQVRNAIWRKTGFLD